MATSSAGEVFQHLRKRALLRDGAGLTDGQLLECYISSREEAGFAALVRRHGPMVWGVCRRLLGNHHDAEDAFQATFLVLVRKATSIVPRDRVGNWLYGVAYQTAAKLRATAGRRRARERLVTTMPDATAVEPEIWEGLRPLLDQELSRLPEKYRAAIVLCDLRGMSYKEAARQLGCCAGTFAARLARARTMLAKRLARQGLAMSGGMLAAVLARNAASASVPAAVLTSTIKTAALGASSAPVAALTEGVLKAMLLSKLKPLLASLLAVSALLGGAAALKLVDHAHGAETDYVAPPVKPNDGATTHTETSKGSDKAAGKRPQRMLRWQLKFNTQDGPEYAKQLEALGARLGVPAEGQDKYRVIRDLSERPVTGSVEDLSKVEHIFWMEENTRTIASLSKALGLKPAPKHVIVFLPKFVEDELLRKELAHARQSRANVKEEHILETHFEFVHTKTGYDIKVASQHIE